MHFMRRSRCAAGVLLIALAGAAASAQTTVRIDLGGGVGLELVEITAGSFEQGSPTTEPGRGDDENQRLVTIGRGFWIGKYPVTRGQFARFVAETGYRTEAETGASGGFGFDGKALVQRKDFLWRNPGFEQTDEHPVVLVTYDDARAFAAWLAKRTRQKFDLPTEAQWEYACRAGSTTAFYHGDDPEQLAEIAWFKGNAGNGTRPVGQKRPNARGLYDMSGQVYQWCLDWHAPYSPGPVTDPLQSIAGGDKPRRVLRGGSWLKEPKACRSAARWRNTPGSRNADNGFRVVALADRDAFAPAVEAPIANSSAARASTANSPSPPLATSSSDRAAAADHAGPARSIAPAPSRPSRSVAVIADEGPSLLGSVLRWGLVCFGIFVVAVVVMMVLVARQARRAGDTLAELADRRPNSPVALRPRIVTDGFWLDSPAIEPGAVIRYRCTIDGESQTGEYVALAGRAGQFIYTGGTPAQVEILEVLPPGQGPRTLPDDYTDIAGRPTGPIVMWNQPFGTTLSPAPPPSPRQPATPPAEPHRGFPPAYS